ncbi:MAG: hypothetical protein WC028_14655 [Candidatus Obscuribacterales bacterium]
MNDNKNQLADFNAVIAYWLKGKGFMELNASPFCHPVTLTFRPVDDEVQSYSDIRLVVKENWSVSDKRKSTTLSKCIESLENYLRNTQVSTEMTASTIEFSKLYLLLGAAHVQEAHVNAKGMLTIELEDGIEIIVDGHAEGNDVYPTDEEAWSLEIELENQIPYHLNFKHCIFTTEYGEIGSDIPPAELLRIAEEEIAEGKRLEEERRRGGPFPSHNTN